MKDAEIATLLEFLGWMYEFGPDPNGTTRAKLLAAYLAWQQRTAADSTERVTLRAVS